MIINYNNERENKLYDFTTIKSILGVNKSKLHRELKKLERKDFVKYKNQHLYREYTLFLLMERILIQRLDKIELEENGFSEDQKDK